jgi:hypothetical protein
MSQQAIVRFLELVASDKSIEATLNTAAEQKVDVATAAVELGKKHGLEFSGAEFSAAMGALQREQSGELDDAALETVAGGFNPQPEPPALPIGKSLLSQKWSKSFTAH